MEKNSVQIVPRFQKEQNPIKEVYANRFDISYTI